MASPVTLTKTKFSSPFLKNLMEDYGATGAGTYAAWAWRRWTNDPAVLVFKASFDGMSVGWIVYDPSRSTVLEVCVEGGGATLPDVESAILDALIERENLVSALVSEADQGRLERFIEYGFRPVGTVKEDGYGLVRMELATSVLLRKLKGARPARPYRKKEKVAIEPTPEGAAEGEIKEALARLLKKLGGIGRFVKPGDHVVIKPNIVSDHGLKDGSYKGGIVTDVRVVKALTELLLPRAGRITIAEGSSINRSETAKMFSLYGYDRIVQLNRKKVKLLDLNGDKVVEKPVPGGKRMISRKIPVTLEEADVVISVPVLKIHFAAIASLAVKHLQGAVPPLEKYMTHYYGLWQNLVNIHHLVKTKLTIVDGLVGQEDFGPVSGTPKAMNLLIGGTNPVAVDAVAMRIMGLDPASSPPVWLAYMQGLGPLEEDRISLLGPDIAEVSAPFVQPLIDLSGGRDLKIYGENACPGCRGYLHFALSKLKKADPLEPGRMLIDRPFPEKVNIFLGPDTEKTIDEGERNIFMGLCQQHHRDKGRHMPGCPPHAEVIMDAVFSLFPDVERPQYADKTEETRLGEMLEEILRREKA